MSGETKESTTWRPSVNTFTIRAMVTCLSWTHSFLARQSQHSTPRPLAPCFSKATLLRLCPAHASRAAVSQLFRLPRREEGDFRKHFKKRFFQTSPDLRNPNPSLLVSLIMMNSPQSHILIPQRTPLPRPRNGYRKQKRIVRSAGTASTPRS